MSRTTHAMFGFGSVLWLALSMLLCVAAFAMLTDLRQVPGTERGHRAWSLEVEWANPRPFDSPDLPYPAYEAIFRPPVPVPHAAVVGSTLEARIGAQRSNLSIDFVRGQLFELLGVAAPLGNPARLGPRTAVISHALWIRHFGGDPDVLGRTFEIAGRSFDQQWTSFTVVGVAGPHFRGLRPGAQVDVWIAWEGWRDILLPRGESEPSAAALFPLRVVFFPHDDAHGASFLAEARRRAEAAGLFAHSPGRLVAAAGVGLSHDARTLLQRRAHLSKVVIVLVVAVMLFAALAMHALRAVRERHADSVRRALGEQLRHRLRREVLRTIAPIATASGLALVVCLAFVITIGRAIPELWPADILLSAGPGPAAGLVAIALTAATLLSALALAISFAGGAHMRLARFAGTRKLLLPAAAGMIGLAAVAAVAFASFVDVRNSVSADLGFSTDAEAALLRPVDADADPLERLLSGRSALPYLEALDDIGGAALATAHPLAPALVREAVAPSWKRRARTFVNEVSPAYFELLGIRLEAGRLFDEHSSTEVVVNRTFSRLHLGSEKAVGAEIDIFDARGLAATRVTVVGVVSDAHRLSAKSPPGPMLYAPLRQEAAIWVIVGRGAALAAATSRLNRLLLDTGVHEWRFAPPVTLAQLVRRDHAHERRTAAVLAGFAAVLLALGLAASIALLRTLIVERRAELAVRRTLGASGRQIMSAAVGMPRSFGWALSISAGLLAANIVRVALPTASAPTLLAAAALATLVIPVCWAVTSRFAWTRNSDDELVAALKRD